ncbi:microfibril-associated glycoprotein 4-like [Anopheles arabiensis]|uniref:microfibril-associated glycoprotein 4-like n=1 Tax=Anopheles arabiensis TaxID=7173 RepID=UPI001AAD6653|nr:microfibril-associated glycoprotein 4-like [Anopheles arabiensis]
MLVYKIILCCVLFASRKIACNERNVTAPLLNGLAFELLATKLEYLQDKLIEIESAAKNADQQLSEAIDELSRTVQNHFNRTEHTANANHEQMGQKIQAFATKADLAWLKIDSGLYLRNFSLRSCKEEPSKQSGKYIMQATIYDTPFLGYCEQSSFGGGWLVVQYRYDGALDFYRDWAEYRNGFGSTDGEFWLGLEHLHQLTATRKHELVVELKDFDGNYVYARYDEFAIDSETGQYRLMKLGSYTGTAGDGLNYQSGMKFTTKDRKNDLHPFLNCAAHHAGGWWYRDCAKSNLNGGYIKGETPKGMFWVTYKPSGLAYSRMLIREI